jgi:hypothetical protein
MVWGRRVGAAIAHVESGCPVPGRSGSDLVPDADLALTAEPQRYAAARRRRGTGEPECAGTIRAAGPRDGSGGRGSVAAAARPLRTLLNVPAATRTTFAEIHMGAEADPRTETRTDGN